MSTLIGRFWFKRTSNGNLVGEFSNNKGKSISTESADLIESVETFEGKYHTSWQEKEKGSFAILNIAIKPNTKTIYSLVWSDKKGKTIFLGEAMLHEDM